MPEEIIETSQPTKTKSFDWPKIILVAVLSLGLLAGAAYAGYWYGTQQVQTVEKSTTVSQPTPTPIPTPTPTPEATPAAQQPEEADRTTNWRTYTNDIYRYSIKYPQDFLLTFAKDYNPPELAVAISSPDKSITIGISEPTGSLSGDAALNELKPITGLKFSISGKEYAPDEAYYNNLYQYYVFRVNDISFNNNPSGLGIGAKYTKPEDLDRIDQILHTFKFLD